MPWLWLMQMGWEGAGCVCLAMLGLLPASLKVCLCSLQKGNTACETGEAHACASYLLGPCNLPRSVPNLGGNVTGWARRGRIGVAQGEAGSLEPCNCLAQVQLAGAEPQLQYLSVSAKVRR